MTNSMRYRVVYGETMPAWEETFATMREAMAFAKKHESFGDIIFGITRIVAGEGPQSLTAILDRQEKLAKASA